MIELGEILRLAIEALPRRAENGTDDEGTIWQVGAENAFYEALLAFITRSGSHDSEQKWSEYEQFCIGATCRERIKEGVRIAMEADRE
jgi:hypothetical protein